MKYLITLVGLFLILTRINLALAQGTNNPYPIDSTDIKVALEQMGIQIFKFPVHIGDTTKPRINYIIEISDSGKVIYNKNFIETLIKGTPKGFTPEDMGINDVHPKLDSGDYFVRLYVNHKEADEVSFVFVSKYSTQKTTFEINSEVYGTASSRAFNFKGLERRKPVPLVVFYMNKKDKPVLSCPGRLTPADIHKRYDRTFIVYAELY